MSLQITHFQFYRAEIITANDDVYIGRIHSHNPRGTVTLIQTVSPPTKSVDNDRSQSSTATQQINFVAINVDYVKSIRALDRTKPRWKSSVNERFSKFIGAPTRIPTETLGERIRKGSPAIKEQEFEFKFRKLTRNISSEGKIILRRLIKELELPLEDIQIDLKNNIVFSKLSIKMFKPYKSTDVRIVASPDSAVSSSSGTDVKAETPVDPTKQKETITAMEKSIDASWKKIEQTQKGG